MPQKLLELLLGEVGRHLLRDVYLASFQKRVPAQKLPFDCNNGRHTERSELDIDRRGGAPLEHCALEILNIFEAVSRQGSLAADGYESLK